MNTNKNLYIALAIIAVLIGAGVLYWNTQMGPGTDSNQNQEQPGTNNGYNSTSSTDDTTSSINQSFETTTVGDVDAEFKDVDSDTKGL